MQASTPTPTDAAKTTHTDASPRTTAQSSAAQASGMPQTSTESARVALPSSSRSAGKDDTNLKSPRMTPTEPQAVQAETSEADVGPSKAGQGKLRETDDEASGSEISEEEEAYESLLSKLRAGLSLRGEAVPKKALKPILESFDLLGIAQHIKEGRAKKIVFMCGAGISVSAGIPDFRSPKTGLYNNLQKYDLPHPQAVFELDYFREKPEPFFQLAKELFPGNFQPTPAHYFMTLLHRKGLLLRCFTQNIDSLERQAGLPADCIVAAHGNFDSAHCIKCRREIALEIVKEAVDAEKPCRCPKCGGLVKPDIVFFGESLPEMFFRRAKADFPAADLLIVMGTSLVVNPFASLIGRVGDEVPRVLINRERAGEALESMSLLGSSGGFRFADEHRDALYLGDCDDGVRLLSRHLGWETELDDLIASGCAGGSNPIRSDL